MSLDKRNEAFSELGQKLRNFESEANDDFSVKLEKAITRTENVNRWFTKTNTIQALKAIGEMLQKEKLEKWIEPYKSKIENNIGGKRVGVIMAGNIPVVGFHDFLCVLISGNKIVAKPSSSDPFLLKVLAEELTTLEPSYVDKIEFAEKLVSPDAAIVTGSNNSARYFDFYFGKYPHIIRKNRNSVAVLTGDETENDLINLGSDIFSYYGLGCRNVSKLYVPEDYDFNNFWKAIYSYADVIKHNKYANNYDYNRAILLLEQVPFLTNEFLMLKEDKQIATPVALLNYEKLNQEEIKAQLTSEKENIQCIVSKAGFIEDKIDFGQTQNPQLWDYSDNVDTMKFLSELN